MVLAKHELETQLRNENQLIQRGILRDENPLDLTDQFSQFLEGCRRGDLKSCQEFISQGVDINGKDSFDYTPLIVASLCGHFELVQLLLESGARAERNTFQGERAVYNALNDRIRTLLLSYDYSKSSDPLQPWSFHITSLLDREIPKTSDIRLTSGDTAFNLHKFLLSARSSYFCAKLAEAPGTDTWKLSTAVPDASYKTVFNYLYLGELPRDLVDPRSPTNDEERILTGIDKISKQLGVEQLWDAIFSASDRRLARQRYQDEVERANTQVMNFFQAHVVAHKMVVDARKVVDVKWRHDNSIFADCLLRADKTLPEEGMHGEAVDMMNNGIPIGPFAMTNQSIEGESTKRHPKAVLYPVHKAMLIRSPYFATMFSSGFLEAQESEHLHVVTLDCPPEVLEIVLTFLYTEKMDCPLKFALDLLRISDFLMLDKLKSKAAAIISTLGSGNADRSQAGGHVPKSAVATITTNNTTTTTTTITTAHFLPSQTTPSPTSSISVKQEEPIDIYDIIRTAWLLNVQRLEEFAARYFADRLELYIDEPEFAEVIRESAYRLKSREETDTIELLDDIRYYLGERFRLRFEDAGLEDMLDGEGFGEGEGGGGEGEGVDAGTGAATSGTGASGRGNGSHPEHAATQRIKPAFNEENNVPSRPEPLGHIGNGAMTTRTTTVAATVTSAGPQSVATTGVVSLSDYDITQQQYQQQQRDAEQAQIAQYENGGIRTLEGEVVEDEFESEAQNYRILLRKIDAMLESLNLDA